MTENTVVGALPETCRSLGYDSDEFIVCTVDPGVYRIALALRDGGGQAIGSLAALPRAPGLLFSMNAGMYHEDKSPVGLYVENGVELSPLNTDDAPGNFFMKPNGVFFVDKTG
ncbi:hypothetical protein DUP91_28835, partial [Salmonella enterica subsp. enterica]|nr:hypothetical protein [Salmonella enterica subsp. enterica]